MVLMQLLSQVPNAQFQQLFLTKHHTILLGEAAFMLEFQQSMLMEHQVIQSLVLVKS